MHLNISANYCSNEYSNEERVCSKQCDAPSRRSEAPLNSPSPTNRVVAKLPPPKWEAVPRTGGSMSTLSEASEVYVPTITVPPGGLRCFSTGSNRGTPCPRIYYHWRSIGLMGTRRTSVLEKLPRPGGFAQHHLSQCSWKLHSRRNQRVSSSSDILPGTASASRALCARCFCILWFFDYIFDVASRSLQTLYVADRYLRF